MQIEENALESEKRRGGFERILSSRGKAGLRAIMGIKAKIRLWFSAVHNNRFEPYVQNKFHSPGNCRMILCSR
jgi:hypothetical protein